MGVSKRILPPPPHRADPIEDLNPVGIAISMVRIEKAEVATTPIPVVNI